MPEQLSKSKYLAGLQCPKRLWLEARRPDLAAPLTPAKEKVFAQGREVGRRAREAFPGGALLEEDPRLWPKALVDTRAALEGGAATLFEASFLHEGTLVRTDILVRNGDGSFDLYEVKATTGTKAEHLPDLAVQVYVCEGAGLSIRRALLMHLDRACRFPDLGNLFRPEDLTRDVRSILGDMPSRLAGLLALLGSDLEPEVRLGSHCSSPHDCQFRGYCDKLWKLPDPSVFDIPYLAGDKRDALIERGILALEDVPPDAELGSRGERFLRLYRAGTKEIDLEGVRVWMGRLRFPLYFLDFETDAPALPRLPGLGPFGRVPFQFSLHVQDADGRLEEAPGFLHEDGSDPRPGIARALLEQIGPEGSIVAYNASFEKGVIGELAAFLPDLAKPLSRLQGRFADLLDIFRNHYFDPAFKGSASIKAVLPVLCPDLGYAGLEVGNGEDAQAAWEKLIETEDPAEKQRLAAALRTYCALDTLAMVRLWEKIRVL